MLRGRGSQYNKHTDDGQCSLIHITIADTHASTVLAIGQCYLSCQQQQQQLSDFPKFRVELFNAINAPRVDGSVQPTAPSTPLRSAIHTIGHSWIIPFTVSITFRPPLRGAAIAVEYSSSSETLVGYIHNNGEMSTSPLARPCANGTSRRA